MSSQIVRYMLSLTFLVIFSFTTQGQNILSLSQTEGGAGTEAEIRIDLTNASSIVAFQLKIPLNDQLRYVDGSCHLSNDRTDGHHLTAVVTNQQLVIYSYSLLQKPYPGSAGAMVTFRLKLGPIAGDYPLILQDARVSDAAGNALPLTTNNGNVRILAPMIQAGTGVIDFGRIPIRAAHTQYLTLSNPGNQPLTVSNVSFAHPDISTTTPFPQNIEVGGSLTFPLILNTDQAGALLSDLTISSNSSLFPVTKITLKGDPYSVNELHMLNAEGLSDSMVTVAMRMNNMDDISGFQCVIPLPQELEYVAGSFALSGRKVNHTLSAGISNNQLTLLAYSGSNAAFADHDGELATFRVRLKGMYGSYALSPSRVVLSNPKGENVVSDYYGGNVVIQSPNLYYYNASMDLGKTPVTEVATQEFSFYNYGNANLVVSDIVFTNPDFSHETTLPVTVAPWSSFTLPVYYAGLQAGKAKGVLKIYSNSPLNRMVDIELAAERFEPNRLNIPAQSFYRNQALKLPIELLNYSAVSAVQFDLQFPSGVFTITPSGITLANRASGHNVVASLLNGNTLRVLTFSMQNQPVAGHSGVLLDIPLTLKDPMTVGDYLFKINGVVLSGLDGANKASQFATEQTVSLLGIFSGLENVGQESVLVYPNPAAEVIYVDNRNRELKAYQLISVSGETMSQGALSGDLPVIDIGQLASGCYILCLTGNGDRKIVKVVKR